MRRTIPCTYASDSFELTMCQTHPPAIMVSPDGLMRVPSGTSNVLTCSLFLSLVSRKRANNRPSVSTHLISCIRVLTFAAPLVFACDRSKPPHCLLDLSILIFAVTAIIPVSAVNVLSIFAFVAIVRHVPGQKQSPGLCIAFQMIWHAFSRDGCIGFA